jgi:glucokinase
MVKQAVAAGIDIGGTNTVFGLVDEEGKLLKRDSVPTKSFTEANELVDFVSDKLHKLLSPEQELMGIGVGAPNGNFYKGTIEFAPNLKWKGVVPLAELFEKRNNCKVIITNDANAAAMGELLFGAAKGMKNFLFITLGTGLGSGIVVNGEVVYGHDGFAGELGHVIMLQDGRACGCGRKGCLETYCSASGIVTTYRSFFSDNSSVKTDSINAQLIFEKAMQGEKEALQSFEYTAEILGWALANSVAYTSPEAIFLFGGLALAGDVLFEPVRQSFEKNLMTVYQNKIKILPSALSENSAAILGAASLIWKK